MASVDTQLQNIEDELKRREMILRDTIEQLQAKIETAIASTSTSTNVRNELTKLKNLLMDFVTLANYPTRNNSLSCDNVSVKSSKVIFSIQGCVRTNVDVVTNNTKVAVGLGGLNVHFLVNYWLLTGEQQQNVKAVITSLYIVIDNYNQYSVALAGAIYNYRLVYNDLLYVKTLSCACPNQLSADAVMTFTKVDNTLKQIQKTIEDRELIIRTLALNNSDLIVTFSADIKANAILSSVLLSLDTIKFIMKGFMKISTAETVNTTTTCDEAALKLAFIEHKMFVYNHAITEAYINASTSLTQSAYLTSYQSRFASNLTPKQKENLEAVKGYLSSLIEAFRQNIYTLTTSVGKLAQLYLETRAARWSSCSCNGETTKADCKCQTELCSASTKKTFYSQPRVQHQ